MVSAMILNQYLNTIPVIKNSQFAIFCTNLIVLLLVLLYPIYKNTTLKKIKDRQGLELYEPVKVMNGKINFVVDMPHHSVSLFVFEPVRD